MTYRFGELDEVVLASLALVVRTPFAVVEKRRIRRPRRWGDRGLGPSAASPYEGQKIILG